jgi:hypothetical protein
MKRKYQVTLVVETEEEQLSNGRMALLELFTNQDLLLGECGACFGGSVDVIRVSAILVDADPRNP